MPEINPDQNNQLTNNQQPTTNNQQLNQTKPNQLNKAKGTPHLTGTFLTVRKKALKVGG
jgi:hypothetical protein